MHPIIWLTGLPCSGKTTISRDLARIVNSEVIDGDDLRRITGNTDFSELGRKNHMEYVAYFASKMSQNVPVIVALVSPLKAVRDRIKATYPNVCEVYVKASLQTCKSRDTKGLYAKAEAGAICDFTGVSAPYEPPVDAFTVDTESMTPRQCVDAIIGRFFSTNFSI